MVDETVSREKMNGGYLCSCGAPVQFADKATKTLCHICGKVQIKPAGSTDGNWLHCIDPEGFEWYMTTGAIGLDVPEKNGYVDYDALIALPMNADVRYKDSFGNEFTRMDWILKFNTDPAIQLKKMRARIKPRPVVHLG